MGPLGGGRKGLVAEINVTPLVDVMLVLLIIFMVTAPMMTQGLEVDLPETTSKALRQEEEPIIVSIDREGEITLNKITVSPEYLRDQLGSMSAGEKERPIFLRADKEVPYGLAVSIMAEIKNAGFEKLGMVTRPEEKP